MPKDKKKGKPAVKAAKKEKPAKVKKAKAGAIASVVVTALAPGATPTAELVAATGVLTLCIPRGEKGAAGERGPGREHGASVDRRVKQEPRARKARWVRRARKAREEIRALVANRDRQARKENREPESGTHRAPSPRPAITCSLRLTEHCAT